MSSGIRDRAGFLVARVWPCGLALALGACGVPRAGDSVGDESYAMTLCPKGSVLEGIDVSHYDGNIDWASVKQSGREFAIMKASEGDGYVDPTFAQNRAGARAHGIAPGAYHFFHADLDPIAQAEHFLQVAGAPGAGDLPLVADVETSNGQTAAVISKNVLAFLGHLQQKTGQTPMIYTSPSFFNGNMGNPQGFDAYLLWVAHWKVNCPNVPGTWKSWAFWQYTDSGNVPGIGGNVDLDRFNGSLDELTHKGICTPDCGGKVCGADGCGGSCGACQGGKTCMMGQCASCVADCAGKACGGDGCGGLCGVCGRDTTCSMAGVCERIASDGGTNGDAFTPSDAADMGASPRLDGAQSRGDGFADGGAGRGGQVAGGCHCSVGGAPAGSARLEIALWLAVLALAGWRHARARAHRDPLRIASGSIEKV